VADRAGLDQRSDHGRSKRAGPAGDDDVTFVEIHNRIFADIA
jgi:hypothetical protein